MPTVGGRNLPSGKIALPVLRERQREREKTNRLLATRGEEGRRKEKREVLFFIPIAYQEEEEKRRRSKA